MIRPTSVLLALLGASSVLAAPSLVARQSVDDTTVLNFALTLEHLENAFYREGLAKLDQAAFAAAGFEPWVRNRFEQIAGHEATHVDVLTKALGDAATKPCEYNFPFDDPHSFASLSMAFETVGASAYTGAARLLSNKDTLTEAASILSVEARQAAWVASAVLQGPAWNGPFDTPLGLNGVFSIASQFLKSCPSTNPKFPVKILPALTLASEKAAPSAPATFKFDLPADVASQPLFLAYFSGFDVKYSDLSKNGDSFTTTIPGGLQGTVYAAVVKSNTETATDDTILTGLAMLEFPFSSYEKNL
ncbi:hypothetical protein K474DRAFT_1606039 [Panus rudis PR-1116 ss-1]|nr:hypothetical protein K474DRAFT_1606039 [Panus rudis PR-1116 ss-1]